MAFDLPYKDIVRLMRNIAKESSLRIILLLNDEEFVDKEIIFSTIVEQTLIKKEKVKDILKALYFQNIVEFSGDGMSYPNDRPTFNRKGSIYVKLSERGKEIGNCLDVLINKLEALDEKSTI